MPAPPPARPTPPLAVVRAVHAFALAPHLIPTASATGSTPPPTFARTARSFTRLPRLIPAASAAGTAPALAALSRARSFALASRLIPATSATGSAPRVAPVLLARMSLVAAAPAGPSFLRVTGRDGVFGSAHRARPPTPSRGGRGPLSSTVSTRAALLCR